MKDTSPNGDKIGDDEFAVPTIPTFKYTLSEEEILGHRRICAFLARQEIRV